MLRVRLVLTRAAFGLTLSKLRDIRRSNDTVLVAEMRDDVVGELGDLGIRVGVAERRHEDVGVVDAYVDAVQDHCCHVGSVRIVYAAQALQRCIGALQSLSVPLVTTCTTSFEQPDTLIVYRGRIAARRGGSGSKRA